MNAHLIRRLRVTTLGLALAAIVVPAAQAQGDQFIPGYTDFPNALRLEHAPAQVQGFTAGHDDFPNHLRVESVYDRARANSGADEPVIVIAASDARSFDWTDAGVGAGGAAGVVLAVGLAALAVRRPVRRTALSG
jgi:hypothetical protein